VPEVSPTTCTTPMVTAEKSDRRTAVGENWRAQANRIDAIKKQAGRRDLGWRWLSHSMLSVAQVGSSLMVQASPAPELSLPPPCPTVRQWRGHFRRAAERVLVTPTCIDSGRGTHRPSGPGRPHRPGTADAEGGGAPERRGGRA